MSALSDSQPYPQIPENLRWKIRELPECSYGAVRTTLVLRDGRVIFDVFLSDTIGEIAKIGTKLVRTCDDLDFRTKEIVDVLRG